MNLLIKTLLKNSQVNESVEIDRIENEHQEIENLRSDNKDAETRPIKFFKKKTQIGKLALNLRIGLLID